jgi:hypothetical protein
MAEGSERSEEAPDIAQGANSVKQRGYHNVQALSKIRH